LIIALTALFHCGRKRTGNSNRLKRKIYRPAPIFARKWVERNEGAAVYARSREIDEPDNGKYGNNRGDAEAEHEPNVVPGHALPSLPRRYYWAPFGTLGRAHDGLLNFQPFPTKLPAFFCNRSADCRLRRAAKRGEPIRRHNSR